MKNLYKYLLLAFVSVVLLSCQKEEVLHSNFEAPLPVPAIAQGPSQAQAICHYLWKTYDLHVYYTLEGEDAVNTPMGRFQTNIIQWNNPEALPLRAAHEDYALHYLNMMKSIFSFFPKDVVTKQVFKRFVLVEQNPASVGWYYDENFEDYYDNIAGEEPLGILFCGDLSADAYPNFEGWKQVFVQRFFSGIISFFEKGVQIPPSYGMVSKDCYLYDEMGYFLYMGDYGEYIKESGYEYGFVDPRAAEDDYDFGNIDISYLVAWAVTAPIEEIDRVLAEYPRMKAKYDIASAFFRSKFNIDLKVMHGQISALEF